MARRVFIVEQQRFSAAISGHGDLRALDSGEARSEPVTETELSVTMIRQV